MKTRIALTACLVGLVALLGADLVSAARPKDKAADKTDELMQRFQALDANGDGNITANEWRRAHRGGGPRAADERRRAKAPGAARKPGAKQDPEKIAARLKNLSPDERREAFRKLPPETQKKMMERFRSRRGKEEAPARKDAGGPEQDKGAAWRNFRNMTPDQQREAIGKLPPEKREKLGAFLRQRQGMQSSNPQDALRQGLMRLRQMSPEQRRQAIQNLPPEKRRKVVGLLQGLQQRRGRPGQQQQSFGQMQGRVGGRGHYGTPRRGFGGRGGAGQQGPQGADPWGGGHRRRMMGPQGGQYYAPQRGFGGRGGAGQQGPQRRGFSGGGRRQMMMGPQGGKYGAPQRGFGGRGGAGQQGPQRRGFSGGGRGQMMMGPQGGQYGAPQRGFGGRGGALRPNSQQANPQRGGRRQQDAPLSEQDISDNWDLLMDLDLWR